MLEFLSQFSPVKQALMGTLFTYGVTALGSGLVFFFKSIKKTVLNGMLGFAAGVMIAASFWSLLAPGIAMSDSLGQRKPWFSCWRRISIFSGQNFTPSPYGT